MAIAVSGRVVKARLKSELKRVENKKNTRELVAKYNHLRIQLTDGSDRHFLFTDKQIQKAIDLATRVLDEKPKMSWVKEFWYEGLIECKRGDVNKDIVDNQLPQLAKRLNHIRVNIGKRDISFLFPDGSIRTASNRAQKKEEYLPKISWLSDLFKEKEQWELMAKLVQEKAQKKSELQSSGNSCAAPN